MSSCCVLRATGESGHCGVCGERGQPVPRDTLEHLLKPERRALIVDAAYYFCRTPECDIVYFTDEPLHYFGKEDLTVRVGVKETEDPIPVCYCFGFTERDIIEDMELHDEGRIFQEVTAKVQAGLCECDIKNPAARCCLGDIRRAMMKARVTTVPGGAAAGGHEAVASSQATETQEQARRHHTVGSELATKTFKVRGITCADCVTHIAAGVRRLPGTRRVSGNLTQGTVKVAFEPDKVALDEIVRAIEGAGYPVEGIDA